MKRAIIALALTLALAGVVAPILIGAHSIAFACTYPGCRTGAPP